jgi:SNF family Na+-dependent transporter
MQLSGEEAYKTFFDNFVGKEKDGFLYASGHGQVFYFIIITYLLNLVLIYFGVSKGIETFCKFAMPIMAACAIVVLIRVLTLGRPNPDKPDQSVAGGLEFMWNPQMEYLARPSTWLAAAGQIFFSLSVGFGIVINYASYLRKNDDVALSGLTASSMNEFFEVCLGGLITIPAAFVFLGVAGASAGGFSLGFETLPHVFAMMEPAGRLFGFLWFFMLFLAAITSSVSMLQPVIAFLEEGLGLNRRASVSVLGLVTALGGGFVVYYSKGLTALDTFDFWVGTMAIFVLALFQALVYGWVFGIKRGHEELHHGAHIRVPWIVQIVLKYVTPVYLLAIFVGFLIKDAPGYAKGIAESVVAQRSVLFMVTALAVLMVLVYVAGKRWRAQGRLEVPQDSTDAWVLSLVGLGWITAILFATMPPTWAAMMISVGGVLALCGYCLVRVLMLPAVEAEHLKAPLDIETGDT